MWVRLPPALLLHRMSKDISNSMNGLSTSGEPLILPGEVLRTPTGLGGAKPYGLGKRALFRHRQWEKCDAPDS